jgi:beta-lactamase regulating signal transducer with metallopeptidase domain
VESLLSLALSNAVVATLLAVLVTVLARLIRRPAVIHALWLLVLLKLLTPPLFPLSVTWLRTTDPAPPLAEASSPSFAEPAEPATLLDAVDEEVVSTESDLSAPASFTNAFWETTILTLWLSGSLIWWTMAGVRVLRFHRLLRQAKAAPESVRAQGRGLAALLGLRRCPPIVFVTAPLSPMLWALGLSPSLLVPADLWARLSEEQRDTLLAHELAHLRHGDHWVRRLEFIVLGLYWWHPVVWWARRRLQEAEEECCDARVVAVLPDAAPAYASVLVETVAFLSQTRAAALLGGSGAGQVPLLKRRLTMILTENPSRNSSRAGFWVVLGLGALLLPLTPGAGQTEPPATAEQPAQAESKSQPREGEQRFTAHGMENCASCHQAPVHSRELQRKPQPWKEAHDDAIRAMEAQRRQRQVREASDPQRAEQIEKLQDEIELLKVQVRLKEAHVRAAKAPLEEFRRRLASQKETNRITPGSVSADDMGTTQLAVTTHTGQLQVSEAELEEAVIRLKQAERRLARLQRPAERATGRRDQQEQLRLAKKRLEILLERLDAPEARLTDFGTVIHGTIVKRRLPVRNSTDRTIRIASVRTSGGWLTASVEKNEIAPRGQTVIDLKMDTGRFTGSKTGTVYVQFTDDQRPELRFQFRVFSDDGTTPRLPAAKGQDEQARLKELERKLETLLQEVHDLRREKKPK